jgi:FG-GAP-like repeat
VKSSAIIPIAIILFALAGLASAQFKKTAVLKVSPQPEYATVADFNNDGIPDLAVALYFPNNVAVLLGAGNGTFPTRFVFGSGLIANPGAMAVGDFNEDGNADIVVFPDQVSFFAGNGDGTFQLMATSAYPGIYSVRAAVADFNHDGHLDIAVADNVTNDISILLGNGDGTFQPDVEYPLGVSPLEVVAADFNNDGYADLAITLPCNSNQCPHGEVDVLLNNQDGTFQSPLKFPTGEITEGIAAADLNNDGNIDLVATNGNGGGQGTTSVLLGKGDGTFASAVNYLTQNGTVSAAIADFDGDGNPDIAVANATSNSVSLLRGNGDGTFQAPRSFGVGREPAHVLATDLNGDGAPDLVFSLLYAAHVAVFTNTSRTSAAVR